MKKRKRLSLAMLAFPALVLLGLPLAARPVTITLGGPEEWRSLARREGLTLEKGKGGYHDLVLKESEYTSDEDTDLLLHFNSLPLAEETGRYAVRKADFQLNGEYARLGSGSGVFQGASPVILEPRAGALFAPRTGWDDFSIEFWLYPASLGDGEVIFQWEGYRRHDGNLIPQRIETRIERRTLVWSFANVFCGSGAETMTVEIRGVDRLIPRTWHHHLLTFDGASGVLTYSIDGVPAGIRYATPSGRDEPSHCFPVIGEAEVTTLTIGPRLTGFLDEFRISRTVVRDPLLKRYSRAHGRAITRVFDLEYSGTRVTRIDARLEKPANSEINFYVRSSDTFVTTERMGSEWLPFLPGSSLRGKVNGRYIQLMVEFFPDGRNEVTPRLFGIDIVYEPDLPPVSPVGLKAIAGDGKVTLSWQRVTEEDVRGYYLFYGTGPLNYQGEEAREGASPIDVGNVTSFTLTGLSNGTLYYFAVAAYDASTPPHVSPFLEEKSARPSEVLE